MFGAEGLSEVGEILFICSVLILFYQGHRRRQLVEEEGAETESLNVS